MGQRRRVSAELQSAASRREHDEEVSDMCKDELFRVELEAADDMRTDAELNKYCQEDAKTFCAEVEPGDGRVQDCLVRSRVPECVSGPTLEADVGSR